MSPTVRPRSAVAVNRLPWVLAIVGIVLAINLPILGFDWLMFDDDINILVNPHLGRFAASSIAWGFRNIDYMRRYLPLGWLGFDGLLAIDGYNAAVFHAVSWVLTGANAALAFFVFEKLCRPPGTGGEPSRDRLPIAAAAVAALVWSIHPLRVENAAWISGLLYLGATTFALIAVLLYLEPETSPSPRRGRDIAAAGLFLASLLVYPVLLALPALLVWRAVAESKNSGGRAAWFETRRLAGWWAAAAFAGAMNLYALVTASDAWTGRAGPTGYRSTDWFADIARTGLHYAAAIVWPINVAVYYGPTRLLLDRPTQRVVVGLLALIIVVLLVRRATRRPMLGWGVAILITFLPFLAQMNRSFHASDRYAVLALAVCAVGFARWLTRPRQKRSASAAFAIAVAIVAALSVIYARDLPNWKNTSALQASIDRSTAAHPDLALGYAHAARAFWFLGQREEAEHRLHEAERLFPDNPQVRGTADFLRQLDARLRDRVGSQTDVPPLAVMHVDLGRAWLARGERSAALAHFKRALILSPHYAEAAYEYQRAAGESPLVNAGKPNR